MDIWHVVWQLLLGSLIIGIVFGKGYEKREQDKVKKKNKHRD